MSHPLSKERSSRCFRRHGQQNPCRISGPLQYVCTNSLPTACWDAWKTHLRQLNRKNNMASGTETRVEEYVLTANVCLQKTLAANAPLWIISLDLSKAFDKIDRNALCAVLGQHRISKELIWILQCVYYG